MTDFEVKSDQCRGPTPSHNVHRTTTVPRNDLEMINIHIQIHYPTDHLPRVFSVDSFVLDRGEDHMDKELPFVKLTFAHYQLQHLLEVGRIFCKIVIVIAFDCDCDEEWINTTRQTIMLSDIRT